MYKRFEKLLEEHNTTIYRVSRETGIPRSTLYEWSKGLYVPKIDKMVKLADYFGVTLDYFVRGDGDETDVSE